jgi:hypothetical protein
MPDNEMEELRRWARGDFYPLREDEQGRDALDELADLMSAQSDVWWHAFQTVFAESREPDADRLTMPFAALIDLAGEQLMHEIVEAAHRDRRIANEFWDALDHLQRSGDAYALLGRKMTLEAFVRLAPGIPTHPGQSWPAEWEDGWSGDALFYLTDQDPDEAWALGLELLAISDDEVWVATIGAFIVEELLRDHGDAFIERIQAEALRNERLQMALPTAEYAVPENLIARVKAAAGPYWHK